MPGIMVALSYNLHFVEKVPLPYFRILNSSNVGSQTKSSHIWQYKAPDLDSTSAIVSPHFSKGEEGRTYIICDLG